MPWLPGSLELTDFQRGRIIGQEEADAIQQQISRNLSIPLSTVNHVITQFKNKAKETVKAHSGHPGPSTRYLRRRGNLKSQPLICHRGCN